MFTKGFTVCFSPLTLLKNKESGIITKLKNNDETVLQQILLMGISKGLTVTLEQRFPSFAITIDSTRLEIEPEIARSIYVKVINPQI